jgi:hypothetical protein
MSAAAAVQVEDVRTFQSVMASPPSIDGQACTIAASITKFFLIGVTAVK